MNKKFKLTYKWDDLKSIFQFTYNYQTPERYTGAYCKVESDNILNLKHYKDCIIEIFIEQQS